MSSIDLTQTILACERARCDALLAGDMTALAALLSEKLVFVHANASTDTKSRLIDKMKSGTIVYKSLSIDQEHVLSLSEHAALLMGRLTADLLVRGEPKRVQNLTLSAWVREDGKWRLTAYQPTPVPG